MEQKEEKTKENRETGLPPAGDQQREELKKREDELAAKAEEEFKDLGKIDPSKLQPDNEILGPIAASPDMIGVTKAQPGFRYKWVFTGFNGFFINDARIHGWVVVQGKDPEAEERIWTDTTRKLGDCILFKTSEKNYLKLQQEDWLKRMRQQEGLTANIEELAEQTGGAVKIHKNIQSPAEMRRQQQQELAKQIAEKKLEQMIRAGRVPGMETA